MNALLVRNIWAVGRNYADHAAEMKAEVPKEPVFFLKAGSSIETDSKISLPKWSKDIQHELEIALWIDENLNFSHISLALDLTARDAQSAAKAKGQPWTLSKSFTAACPLGPWVDISAIDGFDQLSFVLTKNKQVVQTGHGRDMIFKPETLLNYVKTHYPLVPYDVILTGTPAGVGGIKSGDLLQATLASEDRKILSCHWDVI